MTNTSTNFFGIDRAAFDAFHAHLDTCKQCANQPFNLCAIGDELIQETMTFGKKAGRATE